MNIMMVTNTYLPHVGGVAQSVHRFTELYRQKGHRVLVACPEFEGQPEDEVDVMRVNAIQKFNGSDFSWSMPTLLLDSKEDFDFYPDVIHSHHPYFLGDAALRLSAGQNVPMLFTHHTMYEQYTHYVPGDSPVMRRFVIELSTGYANMCDAVIAPSESVASIMRERGVTRPINIIPTGVDLEKFGNGDGSRLRKKLGIPEEAFVAGHLGRLAPEKNLEFLTNAVVQYLKASPQAHFLVAGYGKSEEAMKHTFEENGMTDRVHFAGKLTGQDVVDAYHAMNIFAFSSKSETQGMVIAEAMAADVPVVGLDASGVREVVRDGQNGRLLQNESEQEFAAALKWVEELSPDQRDKMLSEVKQTAIEYSAERRADQALDLYEHVLGSDKFDIDVDADSLDKVKNTIEREWNLWSNRINAAAHAIKKEAKKRVGKISGD